MSRITLLSLVIALAACTGGSGDGGSDPNSDPRCNTLCLIDEPALEGAFDICSASSAQLCRDSCNAQIELAPPLCASCLLQDAEFGLGPSDSSGDFCDMGQCTKTGREGSCTYSEGDDLARDNCSREVSPRREVECDTQFAPVQDCAAICQS